MSIGENIRRARGQVTQADLAEKLKVDVSTISRWETGKNTPSGNMLARIALALGTSTEFLTGFHKHSELEVHNTQSIKALADDFRNEDIDLENSIMSGVNNDMFAIEDKNTNHVYYIPNNEEGRKLFLSVLTSSLKGSGSALVSNNITGDNNSDIKQGIVNN